MYDHKNKGGTCTKPDCWCRGYENVVQPPEGQMDAYRNESPEERAAREIRQAEGLRNAYWDSPFKAAYMKEQERKKVENKWPLAIAWTAILVIIVLGVLWLIL